MNGHRPAGDRRSHGERKGDALVELARQALRTGDRSPRCAAQRPQVRVTIDLIALCADARRRGGRRRARLRRPDRARDGPPARLRRRRRPDAHRPARAPAGRGPGAAHRAGRRSAVPSRLRDRHCVFTGCTAPPAWCDIHHARSLGPRRPDLLRQRRAALRTAPHAPSTKAASPSPVIPAPHVWHTYRPDGTEIRHPRAQPVAGRLTTGGRASTTRSKRARSVPRRPGSSDVGARTPAIGPVPAGDVQADRLGLQRPGLQAQRRPAPVSAGARPRARRAPPGRRRAAARPARRTCASPRRRRPPARAGRRSPAPSRRRPGPPGRRRCRPPTAGVPGSPLPPYRSRSSACWSAVSRCTSGVVPGRPADPHARPSSPPPLPTGGAGPRRPYSHGDRSPTREHRAGRPRTAHPRGRTTCSR